MYSSLRPHLMLLLHSAVRACRRPLSCCRPAANYLPQLTTRAPAALQPRRFSSFKSALASITSSLLNPVISSLFNAIGRNSMLEARLAQFSKHYPDWEGPVAFAEGCGSAMQALMELTNSRFAVCCPCLPVASTPPPPPPQRQGGCPALHDAEHAGGVAAGA